MRTTGIQRFNESQYEDLRKDYIEEKMKKSETSISKNQFGFMLEKSTMEPLFSAGPVVQEILGK